MKIKENDFKALIKEKGGIPEINVQAWGCLAL